MSPRLADPRLHAALVVAAVLLVFGPSVGYEFVGHDDPVYVVDNPMVNRGLTLEGLAWAFSTGHEANWGPLTWVSYMVDVELFGLDPGALHAVNVLLHALAALALYGVARSTMRARGRADEAASVVAIVVALVFAVHPLRAESVCWIAQRKDVLCGLFSFAATWAYFRWARSPTPRGYLLVGGLLLAALLSKPMAVTLPFAWLVADYWPLERRRPAARLIREKVPYFVLGIGAAALTYAVQSAGGAVRTLDEIALAGRLANVPVSVVRYLAKTVWPVDLFFPYPHPYAAGGRPWEVWQIAASIALLVGITVAVFVARRHRGLLFGWLWFLGTLVPVLGFVPIGFHGLADRYTYIPHAGLFVGIGATLVSLVGSARAARLASAAALAVVVALAAVGAQQARIWSDSVALYSHALEQTDDPSILPALHNFLGSALSEARRHDEAIETLTEALRLDPEFPEVHAHLGHSLLETGRVGEALRVLERGARLAPDDPLILGELGRALLEANRIDEALPVLERAVGAAPAVARNVFHLGLALDWTDRDTDAESRYREAIRLDPQMAEPHNNLAILLFERGDVAGARRHLQRFRALGGEPHPGFVRALERADDR